jgi:DNA-binding protein HU-beta
MPDSKLNMQFRFQGLNDLWIFASLLKQGVETPPNYNLEQMRKADLVTAIAEKTGIAKVDVLVSLESFFKEVKGSLSEGENVYIRGFGSFVIKKRAKKIGRHIKENKAIEIPEHYIPSFKPAKVFVDEVKENVDSLPQDN